MTSAPAVRGLMRPMAVALAVSVVTPLPGFLFGAVAVVMREDIHFSIPAIGLGMAGFFVASAIACPACGRLTERIGATAAMRIAAAGSVVTLLAMGLMPASFVAVVVLLAVAGAIQGFASPGINLYMIEWIPPDRQGLAFGIKQASIPAALLISGLSLPALALTVGWRWVFLAGSSVGLLALALLAGRAHAERVHGSEQRRRRSPVSGQRKRSPRWLIVLSVAGGLASFAPHSMGSFLVPTAIHTGGMGVGAAGLLLSAGSVLAVATRLVAGFLTDRTGITSLRPIGWMVAAGSLGLCALALGAPTLIIGGAALAFAGGWGWASLFHLAVVRFNPDSPAVATGIAQSGVYWGAAIAPLSFGAILEHSSYGLAWAAAAAMTALAAVLIFIADSGRRSPESLTTHSRVAIGGPEKTYLRR